ncbi:hypothetical protein [Achromobacter kerstersii]|uniref:hypothetical protein n=1 Tax=Achromobacter kerstersii TaxID=1353890 RepID=UPI0006C26183|nr:hypothetical protein [Achromobacter kerstersii]CUJ49137.1 Uncharacterised protein [Achromobacter kerstersii]
MGTKLFNVYGGIDDWHDTINEDFRFSTIYAESTKNANEAWQIGLELLSMFNGARRICGEQLWNGFRRVELSSVLRDDVSVPRPSADGRGGRLPAPPLSVPELFRELESLQNDHPLKFLILGTDCNDAHAILTYADSAHDLTGLYKLMETSEYIANQRTIEIPAEVNPPGVRNNFTYTANSHHASQLDSRHGLSNRPPARSMTPMSLEDAGEFVYGLARHVLEELGHQWTKSRFGT